MYMYISLYKSNAANNMVEIRSIWFESNPDLVVYVIIN